MLLEPLDPNTLSPNPTCNNLSSRVTAAAAAARCSRQSLTPGTYPFRPLIYLGDEAEGPAAAAGARGTADAVHIVPGQRGQFIIDHQVHCWDVQAPACHVSC